MIFIIIYTNLFSIYSSTLKELSIGLFLVNSLFTIVNTLQEISETLTYSLYSLIYSIILSESIIFVSILYSTLHLLINKDPIDSYPATECIESLTDSLATGCCCITYMLFDNRDSAISLNSILADICTIASLIYTYIQSNEYYNMLSFVNLNSQISIFYYITITHALHVLLGIGTMLLHKVHFSTLCNNVLTESYPYMYIATYWHFVEAVWIALIMMFYTY
uniref:Cytochrome c oxidase subunit 3 n=1 Tax=Babesia rodhaini TaxID=5870 RepID=K7ZP83_BABRO|nr:cytochrome oxidase subunit III [Babesia rodhaini]BAM68233.1 cytochrome oxidase subunit III [Babesia rodhaini]BAM68236.1 cytochrome oxidase subunit III [Babesia rodhaini]BAM68239.1 cytochrome oxidase subunit III [Babesia rodhaini]